MKELSKQQLAELISKASHNEQAFEQLYNYFFPKIYQYIYYRVNNKEVTEDLVSDIFLKVLRNLKSLKKPEDFQSWIYSIARNALIDYYRKKGRKKEEASEAISDDETVLIDTPEDHVLLEEHSKEIFKLLEILSIEQQEVIQLRFVDELKIKEIAKVLDKSEGAIKGLLYRGLNKLSRHLDSKEVQS
ncbi:RNA polymerase sigma factor [Natranaerobius thermophilus]|uniref:RNA polymerase, sigma-24 subunit, ECF subfamily n=1 Tax=Natranaerobius thermophilus (strain ATCC BAA-1301 / DSM 18059 / JW/NM-WN-LF) TaxID=457570 RepID=B2A477_NATTJ|nr:RNA polymerase sigma factor [Natranaerobius thermophilus]ACB83731.1 RNA polymerase, sigma-24 subunit, ECF subfamily [Natranaerobius thermophilus JW/NM-WN-LF]